MIEIENVTKTYHNKSGDVRALDGVSLHVDPGDIFGVIGHSGSGKSTLIRTVNRLEKIDSGRVVVAGDDILRLGEKELMQKRQKMGLIFQHFNLLRNDTVFRNVSLPLRYAKMPKARIAEKTEFLLDVVGLADKRNSYPSQLSGGQKQRVAIARALANDPQILLCDEVTSALDPETTHAVLQLLKELKERLGLTILMITHEMSVIKDICNKVAVLSEGRVVETGATLDIFTAPAAGVTKQFVNSSFEQEHLQQVLCGDYVRDTIRDGGLVARLLYRGARANSALISEISRRFTVDASVIFGTIELIQGTPLGCLYVAISGEKPQVDAAADYIRAQEYVVFERVSEAARGGDAHGG
jgi:D-methionine transport system ATP-binding protein